MTDARKIHDIILDVIDRSIHKAVEPDVYDDIWIEVGNMVTDAANVANDAVGEEIGTPFHIEWVNR